MSVEKEYTSSVQLMSFYKRAMPAELTPLSGNNTLPTAQNRLASQHKRIS